MVNKIKDILGFLVEYLFRLFYLVVVFCYALFPIGFTLVMVGPLERNSHVFIYTVFALIIYSWTIKTFRQDLIENSDYINSINFVFGTKFDV